ncbi:MAG: hypothetical protein IT178_03315 [Acidobacteria bacterium]|nr:hypothetical protein [Acidobacteriota bacterium]
MPATSDLLRQLPHRGPALLISAVRSTSAGSIEATARVSAAHPLHHAGHVPAFLAVEIGAQAAALLEPGGVDDSVDEASHDSADRSRDHAPRHGHLVRVRAATFDAAHLPVDTPLQVTATLQGSAPPVAIYAIEVRQGERRLMHGEITTHRATEDDGR